MASKLLTDDFIKNIRLGLTCKTVEEAVKIAGDILVQNQYIKEPYILGMLERESKYSTYLDYGVMVPHGTEDSLQYVLRPGISISQFPEGFLYHGNLVTMVIGISSREEDPLQELMQITDILLKTEKRQRFLNASSHQEIIDVINENYMEEGEI